MFKDIFEGKDYKKIFIIILYVVGVLCLIYFAIPFLRHDMSIRNSNAMLASYSWDSCGFILILGLIPLIISNILAFKLLHIRKKRLKILFFIPSFICLILVVCYLLMSFDTEENKYEPILVGGAKCELNGKVYHYVIYEEEDKTYSLSMDENDKIPQEIINYDSPEDIFESIEKYYKDNGGMCP